MTNRISSGKIERMNNNVRLIRQAHTAGLLLPLTILFGFAAGGLVVLQSWLLSGVISGVFLEKQALMQVVPLLRGILIVLLARVVFTVANETLAGALAVKVKTDLRDQLLDKINRLGPAFLKGERTGELTTTALQGLDALDVYFSQFLPQILLAVILPVTILVIVFPLDPLTGVVFLVTAPVIPLFMVLIGRMSESHTKRQWTALSRLGAYFLDTLQGLSTLMILGRSKDRAGELKAVSERYREVTLTVLRITFLSAFVLELVATISMAVVAVEIGLRLLYSRILFEQGFFILLIAPEFYLPMRNLSARYHAGMTGLTAARRIFELLDLPEQKPAFDTRESQQTNPFYKPFRLVAREMTFMYPGNSEKTLDRINLEIESGKHYALVGESGAGKSTLAQLLMQFMRPDSGAIMINGVDICEWNVEIWRRGISWVPQKPAMFNTTLLENVRLLNPERSREEVTAALEKALLGQLLSDLPAGLDTQLMEGGARLSGGEAQRVALARAFLKDSPFVLMDEPTAHLDAELEKMLLIATRELLKDRTSITIAHHLSTVQAADEIFVMQHGRFVEKGTHPVLLAVGGEYVRLIHAMEDKE
ncbi:MAG: ATP-binding cassette subfamily C bacterial CydD [Chloroflexi bacterium]|nr:MAG: ATP-binding cassette subfamily C bacterial CydD [Chloroflexota bacterium]